MSRVLLCREFDFYRGMISFCAKSKKGRVLGGGERGGGKDGTVAYHPSV